MASENLDKGARAEGVRFLSGKLGSTRRVLAGNIVLVEGDPFVHFLDGGLATRDVRLPLLSSGDDWRVIANVGATNNITVSYSTGTLISTLQPGQSAIYFGSSNEWATAGGDFSVVFSPAGVGHSIGLVPDPGAVAGLHRFLQDDGTWTSVTTVGIVDAYKTITDGTNSAVAAGLSQLRLRSSSGAVVMVATDNDITYGDVVNFTLDESHIDHDLLLHYVANQHIDHTAVSISTTEGIQGGGTIAATRTLKLNYSGLGTATPVLGDTISYFQTATHFKTTWTVINGILDHNSLLNYSANRHIDHTTVSMIAGTGLTGGGDISASRTFNIDLTSGISTVTTMAAGDFISFSHTGTVQKITFANFNIALDHNVLTNYVANQHIDHTTVSITGTGSLNGGGTIAASRTLDIASNGVTDAKLRQGSARTVIGVTGNASANVADIQGTADQVLRVNGAGTALAFGAIDISKSAAVSGLGTGVATALGVNIGSVGAVITSLTGPITSSGNVTAIASQTGTGTKFVVDDSPALIGIPTAPTAAPRTNTTQIASTAYVDGATREKLTGARTYYVGFYAGAPTITIASPAVVSLTSHGLSVADAVVFSVPQNRSAFTMTAANPGVVSMTNTFAAGQPVKFYSTGTLPAGLAQGTTYYVIAAGLSGSAFQVSATVGGAAINTTALTNTFVNGNTTVTTSAAHNLVVGQIIQFSGTSVINVANATNYYVLSTPLGTTFTFAATNGGAAITPGVVTTQGTFVQCGVHLSQSAGLLPTGITEGTPYYVSLTGFGANSFRLADTAAHASAGTGAINTSGTVTGTPIYSTYTGNDSNTGLAQTRAAALLTFQAAYNLVVANLDTAGYTVTIQGSANSFFTAGLNITAGWSGAGPVVVDAAGSTVSVAGAGNCFAVNIPLPGSFTLQNAYLTTGSGYSVYHLGSGIFTLGVGMVFGPSGNQIFANSSGANVFCVQNYSIIGNFYGHYVSYVQSSITVGNNTVSIYGVPASATAFAWADKISLIATNPTFAGSATGLRFAVSANSVIYTFGGGVNYYPGSGAGLTTTGGQYS